jgi:hypothetical protein
MTLGEIIRLTNPDMPSQDQKLKIHSRRGEIFKCSNKDFDKWGPVAERKVTGLWTNDFNELVIFVEAPADQEEDPQIPGQMDMSDYGIEGG